MVEVVCCLVSFWRWIFCSFFEFILRVRRFAPSGRANIGFFPFDYAQGQNDDKETEMVTGHSKAKSKRKGRIKGRIKGRKQRQKAKAESRSLRDDKQEGPVAMATTNAKAKYRDLSTATASPSSVEMTSV